MIEFNRDQRAKAFDKIPKGLKGFIMGEESSTTFQDIGKLHGLNIEKTGVLADVITLTLVGLISPGAFTSAIQEGLGIDAAKAAAITDTVEKSVFLKIRESMQQKEAPVTAEKPKESVSVNPTREEMIAEIENPTPVQHPISAAQTPEETASAPFPMVVPNTPAVATPVIETNPTTPAASVAHEFIAGKMNETVSMPPQKYSADPYRESLN
ncbi:MAG: hypothetical protein WC763_02625 [Candidatus Paceibacterota bacterium]|jgi:hypothetical protein